MTNISYAGPNDLNAERLIEQTLIRYCRAIDRVDMKLLSSCYWPDAQDSHGSFTGSATQFITWVEPLLKRHTMTTHHLSNVSIEVDGVTAYSESYVLAYHRGPEDDPRWSFIAGCRYIDEFKARGNDWKISDRKTIVEWTAPFASNDPIRDGKFGPPLGRRDSTDPSYRLGTN